MARKILLASGCSYTDKDFRSATDPSVVVDWDPWPQHVANALNLQCVNKGQCGAGTDYIFDSIMDGIAEYGDRVDTIMVLWTGADRTEFFDRVLLPIPECHLDNVATNMDWQKDLGFNNLSYSYLNSPDTNKKTIYNRMMVNPLRKMFTLLQICERLNIKVIMGQGLVYLNSPAINRLIDDGKLHESCRLSPDEMSEMFMKNPYFPQLEKKKKHLVGWPFLRSIGGYALDYIRFDMGKDYFCSDIDWHPNKLGHELFAEKFLEQYYKVYDKPQM